MARPDLLADPLRQAAWEEASEAVDAPCQELEQALKRQPVLNGDETGHRTNGDKRWLWAIVAPAFVVYLTAAIRAHRRRQTVASLLPKRS